jgi:hypothetical protein
MTLPLYSFRWFSSQLTDSASRWLVGSSSREILDRPVAGRAAQCVHRDLELVVERPAVDGVDLFLERAHLFHQGVEVGVVLRVAHLGRNGVEAIDHVGDGAHAVLHVFEHGLLGIELGFLREIADADAFAGPGLAGVVLVHAGHDLHQRGLARAVDADDGDLGVRVELQVDVVQDRLGGAGEGLGEILHHIGVLLGHGSPCGLETGSRAPV